MTTRVTSPLRLLSHNALPRLSLESLKPPSLSDTVVPKSSATQPHVPAPAAIDLDVPVPKDLPMSSAGLARRVRCLTAVVITLAVVVALLIGAAVISLLHIGGVLWPVFSTITNTTTIVTSTTNTVECPSSLQWNATIDDRVVTALVPAWTYLSLHDARISTLEASTSTFATQDTLSATNNTAYNARDAAIQLDTRVSALEETGCSCNVSSNSSTSDSNNDSSADNGASLTRADVSAIINSTLAGTPYIGAVNTTSVTGQYFRYSRVGLEDFYGSGSSLRTAPITYVSISSGSAVFLCCEEVNVISTVIQDSNKSTVIRPRPEFSNGNLPTSSIPSGQLFLFGYSGGVIVQMIALDTPEFSEPRVFVLGVYTYDAI